MRMLLPADVLGDLIEEYNLRRTDGRIAAARWMTWQVLRSLPPLWQPALSAAFFFLTLPLVLLDWFWALIHSLVPLRAGLERHPAMLAVNVATCFAGAFLITRVQGRPGLLALGAVALALLVSVGQAPPAYSLFLLSAPLLAARIPLRR